MVAAWAVALALGALAFAFAGAGYHVLPRPQPLDELAYYPSGRHLRPATLGHAETAADLAWIRAVQYYGEHRRTDNRFTRMEHVFEILTALSPRFVEAYIFGGFALAQEGQNFPAAEALMLKGIEANPGSGRLAFELGFLYYVRPGGRELAKASEFFEQASRQQDAPPQSARFAAFARQNSGNLGVALELWSNVFATSANSELRAMAEREILRIRHALELGNTEIAVRQLATPRVLVSH
jgi:hypothetical protein